MIPPFISADQLLYKFCCFRTMPLPAALLERLKKRGIVSDQQPTPPKEPQNTEYQEEVIAEDYDDEGDSDSGSQNQGKPTTSDLPSFPGPASLFAKRSLPPVDGCPNKINLYHDCSDYCCTRYGCGKEVPSPRTERRYRNLVKRFPLPIEWQDVWEPGIGYYYFWNTKTDEVSWLPPSHPKANVTVSVNKLRSLLKEEEARKESRDDSSSDDESEESSESSQEEEDVVTTSYRISDVKSRGNPSRRPVKRNDLDPMDPASYSDLCPRGSWSDGLRNQEKSKAADTTASGPLFQSRPYPSPGDVLRMNKEK